MISKCMLKAVFATVVFLAPLATDAEEDTGLHIDPQPLNAALREFAELSGLQVMYAAEIGEGVKSPGTSEADSNEEALDELLASTGLGFEYINERTVAIQLEGQGGDSEQKNLNPAPVLMAQNVSQTETASNWSEEDQDAEQVGNERDTRGQIETIVVVGSRNAGIRRYEDDIQPYVVFESSEIQNSFASNLEEFLKRRLPQNATQQTFSQQSAFVNDFGNESRIDLRGLGTDETLILVNGRRMPRMSIGSSFEQADINGIPMSAVERIEVLPTSAAGLYGGGATGGAINIILKEDYTGFDLNVGYDNTFDSDVSRTSIEGSMGISLEDGKTDIMLTGSYSDSNPLTAGERDFGSRSRALLMQNNPAAFYPALSFLVPSGLTGNITSLDGSNLVLDDGTELGSPFTHIPSGYSGASSDSGAALVANAGLYNLETPSGFDGDKIQILDNPRVHSYSIRVHREFADWLRLFGEYSRYSNQGRRAVGATSSGLVLADAPTNPFTTNIRVSIPNQTGDQPIVSETENTVANVGAILDLPSDWAANIDVGQARARKTSTNFRSSVLPSFQNAAIFGEVDLIRDLNMFPLEGIAIYSEEPTEVLGPVDVEQSTASLRISGTHFDTPGGRVSISALLETRREKQLESFRDRLDLRSDLRTSNYLPEFEQDVDSIYLEALIPLVSTSRNPKTYVKGFELQVAGRFDDYVTRIPAALEGYALPDRGAERPQIERRTIHDDSFDYTIGFKYEPIDGISIRASRATGFLPPSILDFQPQIFTSDTFGNILVDPRRGGIAGTNSLPIELRFAGNPGIIPEESDSTSIGLLFSRKFESANISASIDYTRLNKTDEISSFFTTQNILDFESEFPERVARAPLTPEDQALGFTGGEITLLDMSSINVAETTLEAYDFRIDYDIELSQFGGIEIYVLGTYQTDLTRKALPTSPSVNTVGFSGGPLKWRGNIGVNWTFDSWLWGWNTQYFDSYKVFSATAAESLQESLVIDQGSSTIPSQTYSDIFVEYRLPGKLLEGSRVRFGVQNIFNEIPPILASTNGRGLYSTYGDPRLRRYSILFQTAF